MPCQRIEIQDAAGAAANANTSEIIDGRIQMIYIDWNGAPAGTTVTITDALTGFVILGPIVGVVNAHYLPRYACVDPLNAAIFYDLGGAQGEVRDCFYSSGHINAAIGLIGAPGYDVFVYIYYSDFR